MHQFHFLIPEPSAFPSGGNIYNKHLIEALLRKGMHASHSPFRPDILMTSPDTIYILDSIYFDDITDPANQLPKNCIGLIHHLSSLYPSSENFTRAQEKELLQHFNGFIVTSDFTSQYLCAEGFNQMEIVVIEPAPLLARRSEYEPSRRLKGLILGSVVPRKGQLAFLDALAQKHTEGAYRITIAGSLTVDKEYAKKCTDAVISHSVLKKHVKITGEQSATSIQTLYEKSNLFISTSEMETFGMAIQDAVAFGIPVFALKGGYAAEQVVEGVNGHQCASAAELVEKLLYYDQYPESFVNLQKKSFSYVPSYHTWEGAAERLIAFAGEVGKFS